MRPRERRESGKQDLFRSRLDQIIDLEHALVKLARAIDWRFLEEKFGAVYTDKPGHPPLPTRLMARLTILKHSYDLSDEGFRGEAGGQAHACDALEQGALGPWRRLGGGSRRPVGTQGAVRATARAPLVRRRSRARDFVGDGRRGLGGRRARRRGSAQKNRARVMPRGRAQNGGSLAILSRGSPGGTASFPLSSQTERSSQA